VRCGDCDLWDAERVLAVRRAPRWEQTPQIAADFRPQQKAGEICGFIGMILQKTLPGGTAGHHTRILSRVEDQLNALNKYLVGAAGAATLLALVHTVGVTFAQEEREPQRVLFIAESDTGKVWANLTLTLQRTAEPYLPMVVAVENLHKKSITIDRGSFWLSDLDDILYFMPSVKEVRKNYDKIVMDYRMVSYAGIPWENWRWTDRLERANFFPDLRSTWGATVRDHVTLRHRHAMVNLLYFERPRNLQSGRPFFLNVHPKGWEIPIRIRFVISQAPR
jgi:hypothetical protein